MNTTSKRGLDPGSLVYIGSERHQTPGIIVYHYDETGCIKEQLDLSFNWSHFQLKKEKAWITIDGVHEPQLISSIGRFFNIDQLTLEDIMNTRSRPKLEVNEHYHFACMKALDIKPDLPLVLEQFSILIMNNVVIGFQEQNGDSFHALRQKLEAGIGKIRQSNSFYLAYLMLDTLVDDYLLATENLAKRIELIESMLTKQIQQHQLKALLKIRRELFDFKLATDPTKEITSLLSKDKETGIRKYFIDLHDHMLFVGDQIQFQREIVSNSLDLYHAMSSDKTNQVMRLLTIITTIFVPLTFIVGVYGMNFENIPELKWTNGYYLTWGVMAIITLLQLRWFKKNRWI
jgi:magnesium transporter